MARITLARSAPFKISNSARSWSLFLVHDICAVGGRYLVGRAESEGLALVGAVRHPSLSGAVRAYLTQVGLVGAEPEARIADHPGLCPVDVTIHARDGATVLVSAVDRPGARFWVGARYIRETYSGALTT